MASFPEKTMRSHYLISAFSSILLVAGCQTVQSEPVRQIYMQTEDSHPHEVLPGKTARFPFWQADHAGYIDVKCTLTGPGVRFRLELNGIKPVGWAAENNEIDLGQGELQIDIEGKVNEQGRADIYFNFINQSATDLLWHQCYNN